MLTEVRRPTSKQWEHRGLLVSNFLLLLLLLLLFLLLPLGFVSLQFLNLKPSVGPLGRESARPMAAI
jgi:hypothetical protein